MFPHQNDPKPSNRNETLHIKRLLVNYRIQQKYTCVRCMDLRKIHIVFCHSDFAQYSLNRTKLGQLFVVCKTSPVTLTILSSAKSFFLQYGHAQYPVSSSRIGCASSNCSRLGRWWAKPTTLHCKSFPVVNGDILVKCMLHRTK